MRETSLMLNTLGFLATSKLPHPGCHLITELLPPHPHPPRRFPVCNATPDCMPLSRCQVWIISMPCVHDWSPNLPPLFYLYLQGTSSKFGANTDETTLKCVYDPVLLRRTLFPAKCLLLSDIYYLLSTLETCESDDQLRCFLRASSAAS